MKRFNKSLTLKFGSVLLSALIVFQPIVDLSRGRVPRKQASWDFPPIVVVCEEAPYTMEEVKSSVKWWEDLGHEFLDVIPMRNILGEGEDYYCPENPLPGLIVIRNSNKHLHEEKGELGVAYGNTKPNSKIIGGYLIEIGDTRERVLEHEIGHALGWKHFNKKGHMMNRTWPNSGWDSSGLSVERKYFK